MTSKYCVDVMVFVLLQVPIVYSWDAKLSVVVPADDSRLFSMKRIAPAIQMAIDDLDENYDLFNLSFSVKYADSQCETAEAMNEAIKLFIKKDVHAFFGPVCDYAVAPVARQVTFWNMPLISVGAMARDFVSSRRTEYPLLIRAGPVNFNTLSSFFVENFKHSKWNKFKILYYKLGHSDVFHAFCHLAVEAVHYDIKDKAPSIKQDYFRLDSTSGSYLKKTLRAEIGLSYGGKF